MFLGESHCDVVNTHMVVWFSRDIYSTAHFRGKNLAWFSLASRLTLENLLEMSWRRLLLPKNTLPDIDGKTLF